MQLIHEGTAELFATLRTDILAGGVLLSEMSLKLPLAGRVVLAPRAAVAVGAARFLTRFGFLHLGCVMGCLI